MDVCLISSLYPPEVIGGAERHVETLAKRLTEKGHSVSVVTSRHSSHGQYREVERRDESDVTVYRFTPLNMYSRIEYPEAPGWKKPILHAADLWNPQCYLNVRRILSRINPNVVHIHAYKGLSNAVFAAASREDVPILHTLHDYTLLHVRGDLYKDGRIIEPGVLLLPYQWFNQKTIESDLDRVLAPSQFIINKHRSEGFFEEIPCTWLPLGVDRTPVDETDEEPYRTDTETFRVLYTGQLHARKGVDLLIKAVNRTEDETLRLDVLGKGPDSAILRRLAANEDRIRFHGFVSEKRLEEFYAKADLTVVPSRWYDNSPLVIYESYAHGTPVLGANIGGIPELIDEGMTGYLFEPDDINSLISGLRRARTEGTDRMSRQARRKSRQYTVDSHVNELIDIYRREIKTY